MTRKIVGVYLITFVMGLMMISSCATVDEDPSKPEGLYRLAEMDIENDRYLLALEKLRKVKNKFPYSSYSVKAQLRIADVFFMQESFAEAAVSYQTFVELHPNHPKVNYALFRIGKSHYKDIPTTTARDLTPGFQAKAALERYLSRFPDNTYTQEAKNLLNDTLERLAEKELYIGEFYLIRDRPKSARKRFEKLLKLYPSTDVAQTAKRLLDQAIEDEQKHLERLRQEELEKAQEEAE